MSKSGKGSAYEREFCKALSLWWTDGHYDDCFWRTSQSGGRATTRRKKGKSTRGHVGDICATDEEGIVLLQYITFELKRGYSKHTVHDLIDKPDKAAEQEIEKWLAQARRARRHAKSVYWLVVSRRDRREPLMFAPVGLFDRLGITPAASVTYRTKRRKVLTFQIALLARLWNVDTRMLKKRIDSDVAVSLLEDLGPGPS
jgi:hypothetical protein